MPGDSQNRDVQVLGWVAPASHPHVRRGTKGLVRQQHRVLALQDHAKAGTAGRYAAHPGLVLPCQIRSYSIRKVHAEALKAHALQSEADAGPPRSLRGLQLSRRRCRMHSVYCMYCRWGKYIRREAGCSLHQGRRYSDVEGCRTPRSVGAGFPLKAREGEGGAPAVLAPPPATSANLLPAPPFMAQH